MTAAHLVSFGLALEAHWQVGPEDTRLQGFHLAANVSLRLQQVSLVHGLGLCCVLVGAHNVGLCRTSTRWLSLQDTELQACQ